MSAPIYITLAALDHDVERPVAPSRKRRLDHLSWEEKMQRKKMKNRVAAQTSRDRKKAKMDEMESRIEQLENANIKLSNDVESLKALNERLMEENEHLRCETVAARAVGRGSPGPAESTPQQKESSPLPASRAARLMLTMCLLSQMSSRISSPTNTSTHYNSSLKASSERLMQKMRERIQIPSTVTLDSVLKQAKWWGPHQSSWNPVGVPS